MAKANGRLRLYTSYNFTDKDPIIDKMRTMMSREAMSYSQISAKSGVSDTTLRAWFEGKTKRPQYATVMAAVRAMGYRQSFTRLGGKS